MRYSTFPAPQKDLLWLLLVSHPYPKGNKYFLPYRVICLFLNFMQLELHGMFSFICSFFQSTWPMKFTYVIAHNTNSFSFLCNIPLYEYAQFVYPFIVDRYWVVVSIGLLLWVKVLRSILCICTCVYISEPHLRAELWIIKDTCV